VIERESTAARGGATTRVRASVMAGTAGDAGANEPAGAGVRDMA